MKNLLLRGAALLALPLLISLPAGAQRAMGLDFDDAAYAQVPKKAKLTRGLEAVPASASIKQYTPIPKTQGQHGTCVAWATAYCGRTTVEAIKQGWTDKAYITAHAYSPAFLFRLLEPDDSVCNGGTVVSRAMDFTKEKGSLPFSYSSEQCITAVSERQLLTASNNKVKDVMRIFDSYSIPAVKVQATKKSLSEKKPVIIGMICPPSFQDAENVWKPKEQPEGSYGGHAMCVVGYDDQKEGGCFEIQNSWDTTWGNKGYIWISYADYGRFVKYGFEFIDLPEPKPAVPDLSGSVKLQLEDKTNMPVALQVSTRGLTVVPKDAISSPLTQYTSANTYASGTRFRIMVSNDQPAFVYAISSDLTNEVYQLFPYAPGISAALTDKKNEFALPDEDHFIEFDAKPGREFLCVLYSKDPLDIQAVSRAVATQTGSFNERVFKVLQDKLIDPKNINFDRNNISFKGFSNGKAVMAMMVQMEHR